MWIIVPLTFCPCALVSEDSTSASEWRSQMLEQSVLSRSKPLRAKSWQRAWKTKAWTKRLFGRIYEATRKNAKESLPQFRWAAEQLHDYVLFMGNTGLRPDEAKNLQHRDIEIVEDAATGERILVIEVRGKRGVGYCKSTAGAVRPYERLLQRAKQGKDMHAGLVNGGGFLVARMAPLYTQLPDLLAILFVIGMVTALVGTLWKLMQSDVKRMLACSTMGQMGFMIAQCGLGLFPAAIAHLCWHGMFKAYSFSVFALSSKRSFLRSC